MHVYLIQCIHEYSIQCMYFTVSDLSRIRIIPELSLIVTATGIVYQGACAPLSTIISCHLSRPIGLNIFYLL